MKSPIIIIIAVLLAATSLTCAAGMVTGENEREEVEIPVLEGRVVLKVRPGVSFPCIAIQFSDKDLNWGSGTYVEVKRDGDGFLVKVRWDPERFPSIEKGLEAYLKRLITDFYEERDPELGRTVWKAFVREGGLKKFIDTAKGWIDDDFLDTPFNTIYG